MKGIQSAVNMWSVKLSEWSVRAENVNAIHLPWEWCSNAFKDETYINIKSSCYKVAVFKM